MGGDFMAEITSKRRGELVRKVIEILKEHPEGLQAKEILKQVEDSLALTPFEQSTYPNNPTVRRFEKIVRFATIGPVKAGSRAFTDHDGAWRKGSSFGLNDLETLMNVACEAKEWMTAHTLKP